MMVDETLDTGALLADQGYRLVEDAWKEHGRRTYVHDDEASKQHLAGLGRLLAANGFRPHRTILRAFVNPKSEEFVEIEPGGSETTGHFLHHMKGA